MTFSDRMARVNSAAINRFDRTAALIGANTVFVLFDEPAKNIDVYAGAVVTAAPACTMESADAAANDVAFGTIITIKGVAYSVSEVLPDGAGLTRLILTHQD